MCFPIYVSVCFVCFMLNCVGEFCLLNTISVGEVNVFSLKVIVLFFAAWTCVVVRSRDHLRFVL